MTHDPDPGTNWPALPNATFDADYCGARCEGPICGGERLCSEDNPKAAVRCDHLLCGECAVGHECGEVAA